MVEEARIRIVVDPAQARRTLDDIEGKRPLEAQAAQAKPPTVTQQASRGGLQRGAAQANVVATAGGVAVARRFGTGITKVAAFGATVAATFGLIIPLIQTATEKAIEDSLGSDPFSDKVLDVVRGTLGSITDTIQRVAAEAASVILTTGESMSLAKGFALTGQQFDGRFFAAVGAMERVNAQQTKAKFDLSEAGFIQGARNAIDSARDQLFGDWKEGVMKGK